MAVDEYGVSYQQVSAAAEALTAEGATVTNRAVRAHIGTGSMSTISRHLATWRGQSRPLPATAALSEATQQALLTDIERQVAEARSQLHSELAIAATERDTLTEEGEQLQARLTAQAAENEHLRAELQRQTGALDQIRTDMAKVQDAATTAQAAAKAEAERHQLGELELRQQLAKAELRLEALPRLDAEIQGLREELRKEREKAQEAIRAAAVAAERVSGLEARVADFKKRDDAASAQIVELRDLLDSERARSATAEQAAAVAAQKIEALEFRLADADIPKRPKGDRGQS